MFGIGATTRTCQEIQCLPYVGLFLKGLANFGLCTFVGSFGFLEIFTLFVVLPAFLCEFWSDSDDDPPSTPPSLPPHPPPLKKEK